MKKRILGIILIVLSILSFAINSYAAGIEKIEFNAIEDFSITAQGTNNWYYQYGDGENYENYGTMVVSNSRWARLNDGAIANYILNGTMQPGSGSYLKTARVWVAPYDGIVSVGVKGNIYRLSTKSQAEASVRIAHTDKNFKEYLYEANANGKLWNGTVGAGDTTGVADAYALEVAVSAGDRLYFEVSSANISSAEVIWNPTVSYIQAVNFSVNGEKKNAMSDVLSGDVLTCEVYDKYAITETSNIYLVVYDDMGRVRTIGNAATFDVGDTSDRKTEATVTMPTLSGEQTFKDWKVGFMAFTQTPGRYYSVIPANTLFLK